MMSFVSMTAYADDYSARQSKQYTQEAEYYQKKADGYRREAQYYLKKAESYQREAAYYTVREMLTGLKIIIVVPIGQWMIIKHKCGMPPTPMIRRLIIYARQPMCCVSDEFLVTLNHNTQQI